MSRFIDRTTGRGLARLYARAMLVVACVWFANVYCTAHPPYIDLGLYARGLERMPFQGRDLMRWPLLLASRSPALQHLTAHRAVLHSPEFLVNELVAALSLGLAGLAAMRLYRFVLPDGGMPALPFALLVVVCLFDFVLSVPFTFPYDLPATALIGWGAVFAVERRFWALLPVFVLGTWNRETMLFALGVYAVTLATTAEGTLHWRAVGRRGWMQLGVLLVAWLGVVGAQKAHYRGNASEAGARIAGNLHHLANPMLWPNILSASAFLLPWVFLRRRSVGYAPLRHALLLLPLWVLLLLSVGQILELRIYGDISVVVAVAAAVVLEGDARRATALV